MSVVEMVEAMFERSPNYFKQFQKQFKFLIADEKPNLTASNNYAVCPHFESEFCQLPTNHFHVLIESDIDVETMKPIKILAVPCLFTTFRHLFSTSTSLEFKGDTFSKLQLAVDFNNKSGEKMDTANVRKRLPPLATAATKLSKSTAVTSGISKTLARSTSIVPQKTIHNFVCSTISSKTQTDQFSSETLKRVESILGGPHSGAFCQIMDIFMSGFGKLNIDSDLLFVRLVYEEKIQF